MSLQQSVPSGSFDPAVSFDAPVATPVRARSSRVRAVRRVDTMGRARAARHRDRAKRVLDLVVAALALIAFAPALAIIALAIVAHDRGPVFFRQTRVGLDGREFRIVKFRSMRVDAELRLGDLLVHNDADGPLFKMRDDPRVTRVGRILRRHSLDELPQLFNVLHGTMSLVGPRPALPPEVALYDDFTRRRLTVKPGITGEWQVAGRTELSWQDGVRLDLEYAGSWTVRRDIVLLVRTARVVALAIGGY